MIGNWVYEEDADALMQILSALIGYEWDQWDHDALAVGLTDTDDEADRWFNYPLGHSRIIETRLARDPGSGLVHLRIEAPKALYERINLAFSIAQAFELTARS